MNVEDKLQLIRAIEAKEAAAARRGGVVAWTTVVAAALVLAVMIGVANVRRFEALLPEQPKYVTTHSSGAGFAELADHLLSS